MFDHLHTPKPSPQGGDGEESYYLLVLCIRSNGTGFIFNSCGDLQFKIASFPTLHRFWTFSNFALP